MTQTKGHTAVLIFGESVYATNKRKQFDKGIFKRLSVAKKMLDHTLEVVQHTQLPYFFVDSDQQVGNTFAQRLHHAIESIFDQGFRQVITVGTDCPELKASDITQADILLQHSSTVFGPDERGGTYLLGFSKRAFRAVDFDQLDWNTSTLFQSLLIQLSGLGIGFSSLRTLTDLNQKGELHDYCVNHINWLTHYIIAHLFAYTPKHFNLAAQICTSEMHTEHVLRGPPMAA